MSLREYMTPDECRIIDDFFDANWGTEGMERNSTREVRNNLSEVIMRANYANEGTVVTHHKRQYAAFVPIEVLEILENAQARQATA